MSSAILRHDRSMQRKGLKVVWGMDENKMPQQIIDIFQKAQSRFGVQLDAGTQQLYFEEFSLMASDAGALDASDIDELVLERLRISQVEKSTVVRIIQNNLHELSDIGGKKEIGFERFLFLICEILQSAGRKVSRKDPSARWDWKLQAIDPEAPLKQAWDLGCLLLLLYCSFDVPYEIAFVNDSGSGFSRSTYIELAVDAIFMIDIGLSFTTAVDDQGVHLKDFAGIAKIYVRTWFISDLASSFPFNIIITACTGASNQMWAMKLIRLLKLVRAARFLSKLQKLKHKEGFEAFGPIIGIFSAGYILFFTAHLLGCVFTLLASTETEENWLQHYRSDLPDADNWTRYIVALYWAIITISTMGYGDVLPVTHQERMFAIFVALMGAIVFSYCMGTISSLISQVEGSDDRFQHKIRTVAEYVQYREISVDLKRKIKSYYSLCWRKAPTLFDEDTILNDLETSLRNQVLCEIGGRTKLKLPILRGFNDQCVGLISTRLTLVNFSAGDVIYKKGDIAKEMYFIVSGQVQIDVNPEAADLRKTASITNHRRTQSMKQIGPGGILGALALFPNIAGEGRHETATALSAGSAYSLSIDHVEDIQESCSSFYNKLKEFCQLKALELKRLAWTAAQMNGSSNLHLTRPCKMRKAIAELKAELLRMAEIQVLAEAVGEDARIYSLQISTGFPADGRCESVQNVSCAISPQGELLCIEHSLEGIASDHPKSFGYLIPNRSEFRILSDVEKTYYLSPTRQDQTQIVGCVLIMFSPTAYQYFRDSSGSNVEEVLADTSTDTRQELARTAQAKLANEGSKRCSEAGADEELYCLPGQTAGPEASSDKSCHEEITIHALNPEMKMFGEMSALLSIRDLNALDSSSSQEVQDVECSKLGDAIVVLTSSRKDFKDFCEDVQQWTAPPGVSTTNAENRSLPPGLPGRVAENKEIIKGEPRAPIHTTIPTDPLHSSFLQLIRDEMQPMRNDLQRLSALVQALAMKTPEKATMGQYCIDGLPKDVGTETLEARLKSANEEIERLKQRLQTQETRTVLDAIPTHENPVAGIGCERLQEFDDASYSERRTRSDVSDTTLQLGHTP